MRWLYFFILCGALPLTVLSDEDARLKRAQEELANAQAVAASVTNEAEKVIWQKRIELSGKELENIRRRIALEEKERAMQSRQGEGRALDRLRDQLRTIETDPKEAEGQAQDLNRNLRRLQATREDWVLRLGTLTNEAQTEARAELDQRMLNLDAEIRARSLERDAVDLRLQLAREALRLDVMLRENELSPRPTIRRILDVRRAEGSAAKARDEAETRAAMLEEQRASIAEAGALGRERLAHLAEEIATLENLYQVGRPSLFSTQKEPPEQAQRRKQIWKMLSDSRGQEKFLKERMTHRDAQLAAIQQSLDVSHRILELTTAEHRYLCETERGMRHRMMQRICWPLGAILALLLASLLLRRLVLPLSLKAENLHVARRAISYLTGLISIAILALFFLEDLKAIATILGIAGAAVVIALQDLCSAFAGWFVIIASRKLQVGDRVEIGGHHGDVVDIQLLRTTLLEVGNWMGSDEPTGRIIIVPNSFIFKEQVFNYSHGHPFIWGKVDVSLTYETPVTEAQPLLEKALREESATDFAEARKASGVMTERYGVPDARYEPRVMTAMREHGVLYSLYFVAHYRQHDEVRHRITQRVLKDLEQRQDLRVAYMTQRELHEPNPFSFSKGQHPLPPD